MNAEERNLIEGLYARLQQAEAQGGPRDAEAENLIRDLVARQPNAPYVLTQVALVQEHGLRNLQTRIEELERQLASRPQGAGFLGGLFGAGQPQPVAAQPMRQPSYPMPGGGGGFMAGAMQTAMGVAGGVLLGNAVAGLFGGDSEASKAPEVAAAEPEAPAEEEGGGLFSFLGFGGDEEEEV